MSVSPPPPADAVAPLATPDDPIRAALMAHIAAEPTPDRHTTRVRHALAIVAALAVMGGVLALAGIHLGERPVALVLGTLAGAVALTAVALWVALGLGRSMLGRPWRLLALALLAVPVLLFAWKTAYTVSFPSMSDWVDARPGFRCLGWSLVMGLAPMTVFIALRRHTAPRHPGTLGAALGMAAGASAWALLDLYCPVGHPTHLLLGHVLPMVLLAALGFVIGRAVYRVRAP